MKRKITRRTLKDARLPLLTANARIESSRKSRPEYLSDQQEEEAELKRRNIVKNITVGRNFGKNCCGDDY